ncbi:hypothetical protein AB0469_29530 [Streptomyces sp. NPDC093801]
MRNEHRLLGVLTAEEASALERLLTTWQQRLDHIGPIRGDDDDGAESG